ncbi:unnamed protein product [Aphanomyces euteiches]|nr:hypothetical protein AeRB84_000070 [Aphanomyces euteiches]
MAPPWLLRQGHFPFVALCASSGGDFEKPAARTIMQNTSGILPTSSSSANAPANPEPQPVQSVVPAVAAEPVARRIPVVAASPRVSKTTQTDSVVTPLDVAATVAALVPEPEKKTTVNPVTQTNKRRCWTCKQKIALSAVTCRCGYTFCNRHRYAEEHNCVFDFKNVAKRKLEEENPRVVPLKVARIN